MEREYLVLSQGHTDMELVECHTRGAGAAQDRLSPSPGDHAAAWEGHRTAQSQLMEAQQQAQSADRASPDRIAPRHDHSREASVPQLVAARAAATPEAVALVAQSRAARSELTYRELDTWANQVAHHLRALG